MGYLSQKLEICIAEVLIFCLVALLACYVKAMCGQVRTQLWDVGYLSEKSEICVAEVLIFCLIVEKSEIC